MNNSCFCCDSCRPCHHHHPDKKHARFLSSYIEAVGTTQDVDTGEDFMFDTTAEALDIAGGDIELDAAGTVFTLNRPGLYHVEWSMNLASSTNFVLVGLLEGGVPSSALSNVNSTGNYSSGALINVGKFDPPVTVSLHNFGSPLTVENPIAAINTAISMRILRFADGASREK